MRVWLITCFLLFVLVEFYQWAKGFILPLPIYVLAGAFLAIASNSDKGITSLWSRPNPPLSQTASLVDSAASLEEDLTPTAFLEDDPSQEEQDREA